MCEFISWIEKNDKVYFLTAEDLLTKKGKETIKYSSRKEDIVGHGALRYFYGNFTGGIEKECTDFHSPNNFPPEIVKAIKEGKFKGMGICLETLTEKAKTEYLKIQESVFAEYLKTQELAYAEYEKIQESVFAEYEKIIQNTFWNLFENPENRIEAWRI